MLILVLNCGSSSVKYQLYDMPRQVCRAQGLVEKVKDHHTAIEQVIKSLINGEKGVISSKDEIQAVGHRVVHGGEHFRESALINKKVIAAINRYSRLAPLHNPPNLEGIYACQHFLPNVPQVAVFDTAFYQSIPAYAYLYGLPYEAYRRYGIRRYGFHGTSHRYVALAASKCLHRPLRSLKIISCHLGNGCSITATKGGKAQDTSMGFTPLEGLVMGTRCGDVDPAAVLYLMQKKRLGIAQTSELLNKSSGLLGLSGKSNDLRDILKLAHRGNKRAVLSLEVFVYRIQKYIAAYLGIMNGCDALIFTAGIGENSAYIRKKVCQGLRALLKKFKTRVLVIPTDEELMIARDTYKLIYEDTH